MRIAVMGAGALGSLIGAILSEKNDVLLITRGEHLRVIQESGLRLEGLTKGTFYLDATTHYPGGFDVIIFAVKAYDTLEAKRDVMKEYVDEIVITFQNGVGIVDMLEDFDVIPGVTTHGATLIEPGRVRHAGYGDTYIGEVSGEMTDRVVDLSRNFTECGLKTEAVNDIMERRWIKAAVNACINPLTAILGVKNGFLLDNSLDSVVQCIAGECESVLKARGIEVDVYHEARKVIEKTAENYSSMLQDIRRGRRTEVDFIVKPFLTPQNLCLKVLYHQVKFIEKNNYTSA